jgi:hypothetical protein
MSEPFVLSEGFTGLRDAKSILRLEGRLGMLTEVARVVKWQTRQT